MPLDQLFPTKENNLPVSIDTPIPSTQTSITPFQLSQDRKNENGILMPAPDSGKSALPAMDTARDLYESNKFAKFDPNKTENEYAYGQSTWDKIGNGLTKFASTTATTMLNNSVGLMYGIGAAIGNQKFSSLYDNDFFKEMDSISQKMENMFPHYYTEAEQKDPLSLHSVFTANFFWDKIIKNLGFSAGAAITGLGASAALEALGLSKVLVMAGKSAQALEATEAGVAEGTGLAGTLSKLKSAGSSTVSKFRSALKELGTVSAGAKYSKADQFGAAFLSSTGESAMESYQNSKQFRENAVAEYKKTHNGLAPTGGDLDDINEYAAKVGNWSFGLNMALLTSTEYIQLPKIFGSSYSGESKTLANSIFKEGKWVTDLPTGAGKLLYGTAKTASLFFNRAEAFEEGAQYAIQQGTNNFFDRAHKDYVSTGKHESFIDDIAGVMMPGGQGVLGAGIKDTLTSEAGWENIVLGGLSGALMTSGIVGLDGMKPVIGKTGKIGERGITGYGGEQAKLRDEAHAAWNGSSFVGKLKELNDYVTIGTATQEQREASIRQGDILESKDAEADYMLSYLLPRVKYKGNNVVNTEIEAVRRQASTQEGFLQLQEEGKASKTDTVDSFLARLSNIENVANTVQKSYTSLSTAYGMIATTDENGQVIKDKDGKPQRKYKDEVIDKMVYATAKMHDYSNRITQLQGTLSEKGVLLESPFKNGAPNDDVTLDILNKIDELDEPLHVKQELTRNLWDSLELSMRKDLYKNELNSMATNPENWTSKPLKKEDETPTKDETKSPTVKLKTFDGGEENLEIGTDYVISAPAKSKGGYTFFEFPVFKILGENEDGTIKIQSSEGNTKDVPKSFLEKYKVGKNSDLESNTKAKYVRDNANKVVYFNFGKDKGGNVPGIIWYDSKIDRIIFTYKNKWGKNSSFPLSDKHFSLKYAQSKGYNSTQFNLGRELSKAEAGYFEALEAKKDEVLRDANTSIIRNLVEETSESIDNIVKTIEEKRELLDKTAEELKAVEEKVANGQFTKKNNFKKVTSNAIRTAKRLSDLQRTLTDELHELEGQKEELEQNLEFFKDYVQNAYELPSVTKEIIDELENQVIDLQVLQEKNVKAIGVIGKLLNRVKDIYEDTMNFISDLIDGFKSAYPKTPNAVIGQEWVDYLKANPKFLKLNPFFKEDLGIVEKIVAEADDVYIQPAEKELTELAQKLEDLNKELKELEIEERAKQAIINKFKDVLAKEAEEELKIKELQKLQGILNKVFGKEEDGDAAGEPMQPTKEQERNANVKLIENIASTTTPSGAAGFNPKNDDHKRSELFLSKADTFSNRSKLRVVVVTKQNEAELGLTGLIDRSLKDIEESKKLPNETVVAVFAVETEDGLVPVDLNGKAIENSSADNVIFQFMSGTKKENQYENGDKEEIVARVEWYNNLRKSWLGDSTSPSYEFEISQGIPNKYEGNTRNAVTTNLVSRESLNKQGLIQVSINGSISVNGKARKYTSGRPLLVFGNTSVFLENANFTDKQADIIFQSFLELSKTVRGEKWNPAVVNFIKSIMFFGTPKDKTNAGRNQFWVDKDGKLHIGENNFSTPFTEASLLRDKFVILSIIKNAYTNVSNSILQKNEPYQEIIGYKDGTPQVRTWTNYQHYLLNDKYDLVTTFDTEGLDGKARDIEEVPLTNNLQGIDETSLTGPFEQKYVTIIPQEEEIYRGPIKKQIKESVAAQPKPAAPKKTITNTQTDKGRIVILTGSPADEVFSSRQASIDFYSRRVGRGYNALSDSDFTKYNETGILPNFYMDYLAEKAKEGKLTGTEIEVAKRNKEELQDFISGKKISYLLKEEEETPFNTDEKDVVETKTPINKNNSYSEEVDMSDIEMDVIPDFLKNVKSNTSRATRIAESLNVPRITEENWNTFTAWMKQNLPQVPATQLDHLIQVLGTNKQAWGVFTKDGIKVFERAEVGTEYHEAFEAVWNLFLTDKQQSSIYSEFRRRKGTFHDRLTSKEIEYSQASLDQAKESIADEFAAFRDKVAVPQGNLISRFIKNLYKFLKSWVENKLGLNKIANLFQDINTGGFSKAQSVREFTGEAYRVREVDESRIPGTTVAETREIIEDVAVNVAFVLLGEKQTNGFLYGFDKISGTELMERTQASLFKNLAEYREALTIKYKESQAGGRAALKNEIQNTDRLGQIISENWDEIVRIEKEFLRSAFKIKISEDVTVDKDNKNKNEYASNDFMMDTRGNSSAAIKLLFNTLLEADRSGKKVDGTLMPEVARNSYGGMKLLNSAKSFIQVMKQLASKNTLKELIKSLYTLGQNNPDYKRLYSRLKGNLNKKGELVYDSMTLDDWRLITDFYVTFAKQAPEPFIIFNNESGETYFQSADLNSNINSQVDRWISNLRLKAKAGNKYITHSKSGKLTAYTVKVTDNVVFTGVDSKTIIKDRLADKLELLGVEFNKGVINKMSNADADKFREAAENYLKRINVEKQTNIDKNKLAIRGQLTTMADLILRNSDIEPKATFFNIDNEQQQLYINDNFYSKFINKFNTATDIDSFKEENPQYKDVFLGNSLLFQKGGAYFNKAGERNEKKLSIGYVNGIQSNKKNKSIDKLTESERLLTTINSMLRGWYNIIMPSDSATEWMMELNSTFSYEDMHSDFDSKVGIVFKGYMIDEMELIQDTPNRGKNLLREKYHSDNGFRLLDGILSASLKEDAIKFLKRNRTTEEITEFVNKNLKELTSNVKSYLEEESDFLKDILTKEGKLTTIEGGYKLVGIDTNFLHNKKLIGTVKQTEAEESEAVYAGLTDNTLSKFLQFVAVNYAVTNTELHKVLFGDPNNFKNITDALKRFKSSGSPRKAIITSPEFNKFLNDNLNVSGKTQLSPMDYGYTNFDDIVNTVTVANFDSVGLPALSGNKNYDSIDRSDAQMWAMPTFYRETMLKSGLWNIEKGAEEFFQWDSAKFRQYYASINKTYANGDRSNTIDKAAFSGYRGSELEKNDLVLLSKPAPEFLANIQKPIITGGKEGINFIDTMLDKTSAFPMFFSFFPSDSHMAKLFVKNFENSVDYAIVPTGRKLGVQGVHNFYNPNGSVNREDYAEDTKFQYPITNFGIQVETESHGADSDVTTGTQITKQATMNLMASGVPVDVKMSYKDWSKLSYTQKISKSKIYKDIQDNEDLLKAITNEGYNRLLKKLGVTDNGSYFIANDSTKLFDTLYEEITRRETNENVLNSIKLNKETGKFNIAFEASNNYPAIKSILLSIVDKNVVRQKMSGGSKIQLSSALWDTDKTLKPYVKTKEGWKEVEDYDALSDKDKHKVRLFSTALKFYSKNEDGSVNPTEILLPHWFGEHLKRMGVKKTDEELLELLNSEEGKKILKGIGFRIPTQEINSMEVFTIKGFLPQAAGDTVVVPAEITKKAGSDFDVDKLNIYLKNVLIDSKGKITLVPYFGIGEEAKNEFRKMISKDNIMNAFKHSKKAIVSAYFDESLEDENIEYSAEDAAKDKEDMENRVNSLYKQSLQNAYIQSLENLLLQPINYDRLLKPNGNNEMEKLRDDLISALGLEVSGNNSKSPLLSLAYVNRQRQLSILGKYAVGIGALAQSNHALTQRAPVYVDTRRIENTYPEDIEFLKDGKILLSHNVVDIDDNSFPTLSNVFDKAGQYISDKLSAYINGFVDIAKDTFIVELGVTPTTAGTFIFLERIGVPTDTVVWFMNQPIIREYVKTLTKQNSTFLFNKDNIDNIKFMFDAGRQVQTGINESNLKGNIEKYYDKKAFTQVENAEQHLILDEFLKYSKMAAHLREYATALTWDTANFSDFTLLRIKELTMKNVLAKNIFSTPQDVLDNSHIGNLKRKIEDSSSALAAYLPTQGNAAQAQIGKVLEPLINPRNNFISPKEAIKIGNKVTASFLDYIVQTRGKAQGTTLNNLIKKSLLDSSTDTAHKLQVIKNNPDNPLNDNFAIQQFSYHLGSQVGEANNVTLKLKSKDAFTQNQFINALRDIKEVDLELYQDLVLSSVLQSGTYKSSISFTDLLPLEDYAAIVNPLIQDLDINLGLSTFGDENMFLRNNWSDKDLVPQIQEMAWSKKKSRLYSQTKIRKEQFGDFLNALNAVGIKDENLPILVNSYLLKGKDFIVVRTTSKEFTVEQIADMKKRKDWSYKVSAGYKVVKDGLGNPITYTEDIFTKVLLKPINLYGDSQYAQEYYEKMDAKTSLPSTAINNGSVQGIVEHTDAEFDNLFNKINTAPKENKLSVIEQNFVDGEGGRRMRPEFAGKSTMDLILSGDRTRTTRAKTDIQRMINDFNLSKIEDLVGKIVPMIDRTGRVVNTRITKVAKFTQEYQDATWKKEGWVKGVTDKHVGDYPYAIEFELAPTTQIKSTGKIVNALKENKSIKKTCE